MPERPLRRGAGVLQILRFNAPQYVAALAVAALGLASGLLALQLAAALALWFVGASLAASLWVYDLSDLYGWRWIPAALPERPASWISVTTGFDQSTRTLAACLPAERMLRVELYDPRRTTEPSARRARSSMVGGRS